MNRLLAVAFVAGAVAFGAAAGAAQANGASTPRFVPLEIYLDSPGALAAWQFELEDRNGAMQVVGIENGGHAAFPGAPYYDREAVARGHATRIVVADYSLAEESRLPSGRIRLATLHLMLDGATDFELRLITATTPDGSAIDASIALGTFHETPQERLQ